MTNPVRWLNALGALTSIALLASAYYFEYALYLDPCPMCIMQRIATLMVGLGCIAGFIAYRSTIASTGFALFTLASSIFGIYLSDHHRWLQSLPADEVPACGPSLEYMLESFPLEKLLQVLLRGNGNCAEVSWSFMGLSMPFWLEVFFTGFTIASLAGLFLIYKNKQNKQTSL